MPSILWIKIYMEFCCFGLNKTYRKLLRCIGWRISASLASSSESWSFVYSLSYLSWSLDGQYRQCTVVSDTRASRLYTSNLTGITFLVLDLVLDEWQSFFGTIVPKVSAIPASPLKNPRDGPGFDTVSYFFFPRVRGAPEVLLLLLLFFCKQASLNNFRSI